MCSASGGEELSHSPDCPHFSNEDCTRHCTALEGGRSYCTLHNSQWQRCVLHVYMWCGRTGGWSDYGCGRLEKPRPASFVLLLTLRSPLISPPVSFDQSVLGDNQENCQQFCGLAEPVLLFLPPLILKSSCLLINSFDPFCFFTQAFDTM